MANTQTLYHLFVLRLWQEPDGGDETVLRIVLLRPDGEAPRSFRSLEALVGHLEEWAMSEQLISDDGVAPAR